MDNPDSVCYLSWISSAQKTTSIAVETRKKNIQRRGPCFKRQTRCTIYIKNIYRTREWVNMNGHFQCRDNLGSCCSRKRSEGAHNVCAAPRNNANETSKNNTLHPHYHGRRPLGSLCYVLHNMILRRSNLRAALLVTSPKSGAEKSS